MDAKAAESTALEALAFLAAAPERIGRFLALTGLGPADLRAVAHEPAFLGSVLAHVTEDGDLLRAFAAETDRHPAEIDKARVFLAGLDWERDSA